MKKLTRLLIVAVFCLLPLYANANIIGQITLSETYSGPTGNGYYLDYDVKINGSATTSQAFCSELLANGPTGTQPYTLLSVDSTLGNFGLNAQNYMAAAWVAEQYYNGNDAQVGYAQIAIWEILMDGIGNLNLSSGNYKGSDYVTYVNAIFNSLPTTFTSSANWSLAVNPTINDNQAVVIPTGSQNYLVRYNPPTQAPEPATMILLGLGLLGIAGIRRKK